MIGEQKTPLDILNGALLEMAETPVNYFDPAAKSVPETRAARAVAQQYIRTIDEVQRSFRWQELTTVMELKAQELLVNEDKKEVLSEKGESLKPIAVGTATEKDYQGNYIFPLADLNVLIPMEVMWPNNMGNAYQKTSLTEGMIPASMSLNNYDIEGNTLRTPIPHLYFKFIRRDQDPSNWSSELQDCVIMKLAVNSALSATGDGGKASYLREVYRKETFPSAKRLQSRYKQAKKFAPWHGTFPARGKI